MWMEIFIGFATILILFYIYLTKKWNYWSKRGVYQIQPSFPFGSMPQIFTKSEHINDFALRHANETKGLPYYGLYFLRTPILMVTDVDIVKHICVKDFDHFVDRDDMGIFDKLKKSKSEIDRIWTTQMTALSGRVF